MRLDAHLVGEVRVLFVIVCVALANNRSAFHRPVLLSIRKFVVLVGQLKRCAGRDALALRISDAVSVKTNAHTDTTHDFAAHTKRQYKGVIRHARHDMNRCLHSATVDQKLSKNSLFFAAFKFCLVVLQVTLRALEELAVAIHGLLVGENLDALQLL